MSNDLAQLLESVDTDAMERPIATPSGVSIAKLVRKQGGYAQSDVWHFPSPEAERSCRRELDEVNTPLEHT